MQVNTYARVYTDYIHVHAHNIYKHIIYMYYITVPTYRPTYLTLLYLTLPYLTLPYLTLPTYLPPCLPAYLPTLPTYLLQVQYKQTNEHTYIHTYIHTYVRTYIFCFQSMQDAADKIRRQSGSGSTGTSNSSVPTIHDAVAENRCILMRLVKVCRKSVRTMMQLANCRPAASCITVCPTWRIFAFLQHMRQESKRKQP